MSDHALEYSPQFTSNKRNLIIFSTIAIFLYIGDVTITGIMRDGIGMEINNDQAISLMLFAIISYLWIKYNMYVNQEIKSQLPLLKLRMEQLFFDKYASEHLDKQDKNRFKEKKYYVSTRDRDNEDESWMWRQKGQLCQLTRRKLYGKPYKVTIRYSVAGVMGEIEEDLGKDKINELNKQFSKEFFSKYPNYLEIYAPHVIALLGIAASVLK